MGEHNATELEIKPPVEMSECDKIISYKIAFELSNNVIVRSEPMKKASILSFALPVKITSSPEISVQLEGYSESGDLVVKSRKLTKLKFEDSVRGVDNDQIPLSQNSTLAEVAANTLARHTHSNQSTLDSLYESAGVLTFKGKRYVAERPTDIVEVDTNNISISGAGTVNIIGLWEIPENSTLKIGSEIKSIEVKAAETEDAYIPLSRMNIIDRNGYSLLFDNIYASSDGGIVIFSIYYLTQMGWFVKALNTGSKVRLKITYYTD